MSAIRNSYHTIFDEGADYPMSPARPAVVSHVQAADSICVEKAAEQLCIWPHLSAHNCSNSWLQHRYNTKYWQEQYSNAQFIHWRLMVQNWMLQDGWPVDEGWVIKVGEELTTEFVSSELRWKR